MIRAVVAEKPSVARAIARVLGADRPARDAFVGNGFVVTWLLGHVAELAEPGDVNPRWRAWRLDELPILPRAIPWRVTPRGRSRFDAARQVVLDPSVERVIAATDAGREGELIFRVFWDLAGIDKPVDRLWLSALTDRSIREGFERLRPASALDRLGAAALGRAWADWWVGMNASRALSLVHGMSLVAGRVKTPTLALVVEADRLRERFRPIPFAIVKADLRGPASASWSAWVAAAAPADAAGGPPEAFQVQRFDPESPDLAALRKALVGARARVERIRRVEGERPAPPPFDLDGLQIEAHAQLGLTARATLDVAQRLYERRLITYPRTESTFVPKPVAEDLPSLAKEVSARRGLLCPRVDAQALPWVDDARVRDHHAILPTLEARPAGLDPADDAVLDLIDRRLLAALEPAVPFVEVKVVLVILGPEWMAPPRLLAEARWVPGLYGIASDEAACPSEVELRCAPGGAGASPGSARVFEQAGRLPEGLTEGAVVEVRAAQSFTRADAPPALLDDASLLLKMARAGLGTPATRAEVIEDLIERGYLERPTASPPDSPPRARLFSTPLGRRLVDGAPPLLLEPSWTAELETLLGQVERGEAGLDDLVARCHRRVEALTRAVVCATPVALDGGGCATPVALDGGGCATGIRLEPEVPLPEVGIEASPRLEQFVGVLEEAVQPELVDTLRRALGAEKSVVLGALSPWLQTRYALLAARARPLPGVIVGTEEALLDDETMQLRALGVRADRLHGGRSADAAEETARRYLGGGLDLLFLGADRLGLPSARALLAERRPGVLVLDDVHRAAVSSGEHLRSFSRVRAGLVDLLKAHAELPVVALSAALPSSTLNEAIEALGLLEARQLTRLREASRADMLALEVTWMPAKDRLAALRQLARRAEGQLLVRCLDAKSADALAAALGGEACHEGRPREASQAAARAFQEGALSVLVATAAFSSRLEVPGLRALAFLGAPVGFERLARQLLGATALEDEVRVAILVDRSDLEAAEARLERELPNEAALELVAGHLGDAPVAIEALRVAAGLEPSLFERCLLALEAAGGAVLDDGDDAAPGFSGRRVRAGAPGWAREHRRRRQRRASDLRVLKRWLTAPTCRLEGLMRALDDGRPADRSKAGEAARVAPRDHVCGLCDACDPDSTVTARWRVPTEEELAAMRDMLVMLKRLGPTPRRRLLHTIQGPAVPSRRALDRLVDALASAGLIRLDSRLPESELVMAAGETGIGLSFVRLPAAPEDA